MLQNLHTKMIIMEEQKISKYYINGLLYTTAK